MRRSFKVALILLAIFGTLFSVGYLYEEYKSLTIKVPDLTIYNTNNNNATAIITVAPFPVGVDPERRLIIEADGVEEYLMTSLASNHRRRDGSWWARLTDRLWHLEIYQHLAATISRTLVIFSGERKEEVVDNFGDILKWGVEDRLAFSALVSSTTPAFVEGKFYPGTYVVPKEATPEAVAGLVTQKFYQEVLLRYTPEVDRQVPLNQALIIASLLEREAYDFEDMRYISGIIWNRLFAGMKLQLDATLQYARANQVTGEEYWQVVKPDDKFIESPFNTYENSGLPPHPIANPSIDAILATLNPRVTDCMFYFHEDDGTFHCTKTYEEHIALLKKLYGRGR